VPSPAKWDCVIGDPVYGQHIIEELSAKYKPDVSFVIFLAPAFLLQDYPIMPHSKYLIPLSSFSNRTSGRSRIVYRLKEAAMVASTQALT
jgi:hypothetical protein